MSKRKNFRKLASAGLVAFSATMFAGVGLLVGCETKASISNAQLSLSEDVSETELTDISQYPTEKMLELLSDIQSINGTEWIIGEDGISFISGNGAPTIDLGNVCDTYVDFSTKDLYRKTKLGWQKVGSIATGTESNPIVVSSVEDFMNITSYDEGTYFKLNADLDLQNVEFDSSECLFANFKGTIDGNYHRIYMPQVGYKNAGTIFNYIDGEVKNLTLEYGNLVNQDITFAYASSESIKFTNVTTNGVVQASSGNTSTNYSPFIGRLYGSSSFINCTNNVDISGVKYGSAFVGGYIRKGDRMVANRDGTERSGTEGFMNDVVIEFINCVNNGDLNMTTASMLWGNSTILPQNKNLIVEGCVNNGTIVGTQQAALFCGMYDDGGSSVEDHMIGLKEINDRVDGLITGEGQCFVNSLTGLNLTKDDYNNMTVTVPTWEGYTYKLALNCLMFYDDYGSTIQLTATFNITQDSLIGLSSNGLSGKLKEFRRWRYIGTQYISNLDMNRFTKVELTGATYSQNAEYYGTKLYLVYSQSDDLGYYCFEAAPNAGVVFRTSHSDSSPIYKDIALIAYDSNDKAVGQAIIHRDVR